MKPLLKNWLFRNNKFVITYCNTALFFVGKSCVVLLLIFFPCKVFAQNLVPNYSFEVYDTCPDNIGQIERALPWQAAGNTPDYFNSCSITPTYGVPAAAGGFQYAHTGIAYAGIVGSYFMGVQREYIQVKLSDTLLSNECYMVSFYVNLMNRSVYASNNLAIAMTDTSFVFSGFGVYSLSNNISKFDNLILADTVNWVEIKGIYTALGNECFISIGNFKDDIETDTLPYNPWPSGTYNGTYYLIDDVSVIPIDSIPGGMSANAGNDMTILGGDSVFIGQEITNLNCDWYIGTTLIADSISGIFVSPTVNTTYIVEQNLCGIITYDTVTVFVSGVGINESDWSKKINIYPNPNTGEFALELNGGGNTRWSIIITDIQGRVILNELSDNSSLKLKPVAENGVYIVHITNVATNETVIRKLIIQK